MWRCLEMHGRTGLIEPAGQRLSVSETTEEVTEEKMQVGDDAEKKWREKNVEGDDGSRTIECLRGRLLAERTSSRAAKEEAELMRSKLIELERQLKAEIEAKNRTEKKLKFLTKKLESLKFAPVSDQLSSSETSSGLKNPEERKPDLELAGSIEGNSQDEPRERKETSTSADPSHDDSVTGDSNASQMQWSEGSTGSEIAAPEAQSSKELVVTDDFGLRESESGESDPAEEVDNSLAIVPVSTPTSPKHSGEPQIINSDGVRDVLAALRHAREKLHSYIGTRDGNHGFHCRSGELCSRV
ncbi:hypothetical protein NE237_004599 [Protea cynaroides]|uniref:Uncharacterized protein n=1 Tax=Protea cynaroides TaxID=273540 RepID=A0A9Q0QTH5_9MAGN|nr:hypothetical protein NE237_004599 [Protea cynaroides]